MRITIIVTILFVFVQLSFSQSNKIFTKEQLLQDLDYVELAITQIHPRPYAWHSKAQFKEWFEEVRKKINSTPDDQLTENNFRKLIFPIYQKLGCGHSRILTTSGVKKELIKQYKKGVVKKMLPINPYIDNGKLYVDKYFLEDSLVSRGDQILTINGITSDSLINLLSLQITSDGYNTTHYTRGLNKNFRTYYQRMFDIDSKTEVTIIDSLGVEKTLTLPAELKSKPVDDAKKKAKKAAAKARKKNTTPNADLLKNKPKKKDKKIVFKKGNYVFWNSLRDSSLAILRVPKFAGRKGIKIYKKAFKYINETPRLNNLVVDLRGNGGGDASESVFLTSLLIQEKKSMTIKRRRSLPKKGVKALSVGKLGLWLGRIAVSSSGEKIDNPKEYEVYYEIDPHKKFNFDKNVYVLIDGYSFSASCVVSSMLEQEQRAIFIGEETGGGYAGTNAMQTPVITLPNTMIRIRAPLWALYHNIKTEDKGHGIFPDYPTHATMQNHIDKYDVDMEKVYELIETKTNLD